jgi:hypothetical protein
MLEHWTVENHLFGLSARHGALALDEAAFSCCSGSGIQVDPDEPRNARMCGLRRRWNLVFRLQTQMAESGLPQGASLPAPGILLFHSAREWQRVREVSRGGLLPLANPAAHEMSAAYFHAVVSSWHLGVVTLVARLDEDRLPVQGWLEVLSKFTDTRTVMFIEAAKDMWHPLKVEMLEAAIAFAYERSIPIWIFESGTAGPASEPSRARKFKAAVEERVRHQKNKSCVSYLSAQALSRLSELCDVPSRQPQASVIPDIV